MGPIGTVGRAAWRIGSIVTGTPRAPGRLVDCLGEVRPRDVGVNHGAGTDRIPTLERATVRLVLSKMTGLVVW